MFDKDYVYDGMVEEERVAFILFVFILFSFAAVCKMASAFKAHLSSRNIELMCCGVMEI